VDINERRFFAIVIIRASPRGVISTRGHQYDETVHLMSMNDLV
jgi:hypothetical protein